MPYKISDIAQKLQGKVIGNGDIVITGITNIENPETGKITFLQEAKNLKGLEASPIACLIVPETITSSSKPLIQVKHPKLAWAKLLGEFYPTRSFKPGISTQAYVSPKAKLGKNVTIEAYAYISDEVEIGEGSVIRSFSYLDEAVRVGSNTLIHPNVMVYDHSQIGSQVIIHSGTVIGSDGFGYVHLPSGQEKVPQVGNVVIEDQVELGACVTIDRATIGSTVIGKGCKIDNAVQIAHNVVIKEHTVISSQTGISGSCKIGSHVTMGGKVGLGDHVEIGDWTMVGAGAGFPTGKKVPEKQVVFGQPARPYQEARRQIAAQLRAAEMMDDIRALKKQVAELEKKLRGSAVSPADQA